VSDFNFNLRLTGSMLVVHSGTINALPNISPLVLDTSNDSYKTSTVGNYQEVYEHLLVSGRTSRNSDFVQSGGYNRELFISLVPYTSSVLLNSASVLQFPISSTITQSKNATLSERKVVKNVIVEKFSAPGGYEVNSRGSLDTAAEEFSPYNALPYRNLRVKNIFKNVFSNFSTREGYNGRSSVFASEHKTQRNTKYVMKYSGSYTSSVYDLYTSSLYDNDFIKTAIPRYHHSTQWIKSLFSGAYTGSQTFSQWLIISGSRTDATIPELMFGRTVNTLNTYPLSSSATNIFSASLRDYNQIRHVDVNQIARDRKNNKYYTFIKKPGYNSRSVQIDATESSSYAEPPINKSNILLEMIYIVGRNTYSFKHDIFDENFSYVQLRNFYNLNENEFNFFEFKNTIKTPDKYKTYQTIYPGNKTIALETYRERTGFSFPQWHSNFDTRISQAGAAGTYTSSYFAEKITVDVNRTNVTAINYAISTGSIWHLDMASGSDGTLNAVPRGELYLSKKYPVLYSWLPGPSRTPIHTVHDQASSFPFYDSENSFMQGMKQKYQDKIQVPEFTVENIILKYTGSTLTLFTHGPQIISGNILKLIDDVELNIDPYIVSTKQIIQNKIEKIRFKINAVKKLRPYKNFYPVQKILQIAQIFSSSLAFTGTSALPLFRSLFAPGILFNTVKAGIPLTFPYIFAPVGGLTTTFGDISGTNLSDHIPFELIYEPFKYLRDVSMYDFSDASFWSIYTGSTVNKKYTDCVTNFIKETTNFFMKNSSLNYFSSKKESEFSTFTTNYTYSMDINLNNYFNNIDGNYMLSNIYSECLMFGPYQLYNINSGAFSLQYTLSPYLPPYFKRFAFDGTTKIISPKTYPIYRINFVPQENRQYDIDEIFSLSTYEIIGSDLNNVSIAPLVTQSFGIESKYQNLNKSFNLFEKTKIIENNIEDYVWNISGKWETPVFNYEGVQSSSEVRYAAGQNNPILGLWHQYGKLHTETSGLFLNVSDFSGTFTGSTTGSYKSLADMVGFTKDQSVKLCELKDSQKLSELIVMIPYIPGSNFYFEEVTGTLNYNKNYNFFNKYLFPPQYDYRYGTSKSILMFCTEISTILSKEDLGKIWQNVLPTIGLKHEEETTYIDINLYDNLFVERIMKEDVHWKIFKVKQRSVTNAGGKTSFNWPYDNCSLLELLSIDLEIDYKI
jgi:hypothetical protein